MTAGSVAGLLFALVPLLFGLPFVATAFGVRNKADWISVTVTLIGAVVSLFAICWWIAAVSLYVRNATTPNGGAGNWLLWLAYSWVGNMPSYAFYKMAKTYQQDEATGRVKDKESRKMNMMAETWLNFTSLAALFPLVILPFLPGVSSALRHLTPF